MNEEDTSLYGKNREGKVRKFHIEQIIEVL